LLRYAIVLVALTLALGIPQSLWAQANLENPQAGSSQSGIGVVAGWGCNATRVDIVFGNAPAVQAAYCTDRNETGGACGKTTTGFGLLVNWNLLGDGTHTVRALADGTEFARATFTVTTLGVEFLRGVNGNCRLEDFPHSGDSITMRWQESTQNFAIIEKCFSSQPCMMMGPLSVSTANPRYFSDRNGNAVYLTGSHNWYSLQDAGQLEHPVTTLDYNSYLNFLQSHNHNFFRLWSGEGWEASSSTSQYSAPISFRLLGGSCYNNPKFDLHQFYQNYLYLH